MTPKAFLFDSNRCTGCQACELACSIENELDGFSWRQVVTLNEARHPGVPTIHLSLACNHCAEPPCMEHCPALAYSKDPHTGRVELDAESCIGCGYCAWACPYDAPRFDQQAGVMTKCTFCGHRQAEGLQPACVEQCPTGALGFGPMDELSPIEEGVGLPTLAPGPAIRFVPWRRSVVETGGTPQNGATAETDQATRKISLRKEWPLVAFTWIAALLVAAFVADAAGSPWFELSPWAFFTLAALGMGASTAHLGKPLRAWRALLNWRHSWLSREIALFSAFAGLATLDFLMPTKPWLALAAGFCGLAALYAIDRVYDLVRPPEARLLHSADVVLTGALLTALLLGKPWVTGAVALIELVLYLWRKVLRRQRGKTVRWAWSVARLGLGFAVPLGLALTGAQHWTAWALVSVLLGELIDRCEFYEELEVPTPRGQMDHELAARLQRPAA